MSQQAEFQFELQAEGGRKEVLFIDADEKTQELWEAFCATEEQPVTWGADQQNDVRNIGFADSHSTGNRQRFGDQFPVVQKGEPEDKRRPELKCDDRAARDLEVLLSDQFLKDNSLSLCGVPDTACRKTLVGKETLARIESHLLKFGLRIRKKKVSNEFRFGNAGTLMSHEVAMIPACVQDKKIVVKAAILPDKCQASEQGIFETSGTKTTKELMSVGYPRNMMFQN